MGNRNIKQKDIYKVWDGEGFNFTLEKIVQISGGLFNIPPEFLDVLQKPVLLRHGTLDKIPNKLTVLFLPLYSTMQYDNYVNYAEKGVIVVSPVVLKDKNGRVVPSIVIQPIQKLRTVWCMIGAYIKQIIEKPTVAVTGSIGKTTTVAFMKSIFSQKNNVFSTERNQNISAPIVSALINKFSPEYDYHIQEVGGGGPTVVERSASILTPDAFCITNVYPHHLDKYKTIDGIVYDKTSLDRFAKKDAFGVINIDDDILRNFKFKSRVVTCGIEQKTADYVAENIVQDGRWLKLDVVHKDSRTSLRVNIPGTHNAYNIVLAYAMAKEWGFSDEDIKSGLEKYTSGLIRQSICEVSGRTLYIDCFNVCVDSIKSCLKTLDAISVPEGGRRIAVIGGENALGNKAYKVNYEVGLEMNEYNTDEFIFIGLPKTATLEELNYCGHGRAVYEGAKRVVRDRPVSFFDDLEEAANKLIKDTKPGDIILFKGIFRLPLFAIIDRAFGTSYTVYDPNFKAKTMKEDGFTGHYYSEIDGINFVKADEINAKLKLPALINEKPLFRIGRQVFADQTKITDIDVGRAVKNIGIEAFRGLTKLKELKLPKNVLYIEAKAFEDCSKLASAELLGVEHISKEAFKNCKNLKKVILSEACKTIEEDVFLGCDDITVIAPENSYAQQYAARNGYKFKTTE